MKKNIYFFIFIFSCFATQAQTLTVQHNSAGDLGAEINAQYPSVDLDTYTSLVIDGGSLNRADCNTITTRLSHITSLDFSATSFVNHIIPKDGGDGPGSGTFSLLTSLQTVIFPDSLKVISDYTFSNCSLKTIEFDEGSLLETIGVQAFAVNDNLQTITFPSNLTSIEDNAFYQCTALSELTFPLSLTSIADYAFSSCTSLVRINAPWTDPITIGALSFDGAGPVYGDLKKINVYVPRGSEDSYIANANWNKMTIVDDSPTGLNDASTTHSVLFYDSKSQVIRIDNSTGNLLQIFDTNGRVVMTERISKVDSSIDLVNLYRGVYLVKLGDKVLKIVK